MKPVTITLSTYYRHRIDHLIKTQQYESLVEVVREGLRLVFREIDRASPPVMVPATVTMAETKSTRLKSTPPPKEPDPPTPEEIERERQIVEQEERAAQWKEGERQFQSMEWTRLRAIEMSKPSPTKAEMDAATEEARTVYAQLAAKHWPIPDDIYLKWLDKYRIAYTDVIVAEFVPPAKAGEGA